jgi:NADPH:quinone reductase-like Zn-dependent oxidoreductase
MKAIVREETLAARVQEFEAQKIGPVIDKRYPLSEVPEAIRYLGEGHARGKVVIAV